MKGRSIHIQGKKWARQIGAFCSDFPDRPRERSSEPWRVETVQAVKNTEGRARHAKCIGTLACPVAYISKCKRAQYKTEATNATFWPKIGSPGLTDRPTYQKPLLTFSYITPSSGEVNIYIISVGQWSNFCFEQPLSRPSHSESNLNVSYRISGTRTSGANF
jgi:hypothetical protein